MSDKKMQYKLTVLVCTYNPVWEKLKRTLLSILKQSYEDYEIIVTDDGSKENCFEEAKQLFDSAGFADYQLTCLEQNGGTVKNIKNGLAHAKGEYVKCISPGDNLFAADTLECWMEYIESRRADVCFGNAVYYRKEGEDLQCIGETKYPVNGKIYDRPMTEKKFRQMLLNYICLKDTPNGAVFIVKTDLFRQYLDRLPAEVKYAEDNAYRLMVADRGDFCYYDRNVIWYEFGTGISTSDKENKWAKIIEAEVNATLSKMPKCLGDTGFEKRMKRLIHGGNAYSALKYFILPELIGWKIRKMCCKTCTDTGYSIEDYNWEERD
ncbi:MAG: glycosyltransferase family 2 protein [Lachnospiraceae bacterium]|nr:glycosyltransferase family 2 protein [Lachnospiraceae bacterium]